jgi:hypothetical protein
MDEDRSGRTCGVDADDNVLRGAGGTGGKFLFAAPIFSSSFGLFSLSMGVVG